MFTRTFLALGLASLPGVVQPATAGQSELQQIRAEMREIRQAYETRIKALENRIEELEGRRETAAAETAAETPAPAQTTEPPQASAPTPVNAFNPAISLILEGTYTDAPDGTRLLPRFFSAEEIGPEKRGFSLAESELNLSASIDPYLYAQPLREPGDGTVRSSNALDTDASPHRGVLVARRVRAAPGWRPPGLSGPPRCRPASSGARDFRSAQTCPLSLHAMRRTEPVSA